MTIKDALIFGTKQLNPTSLKLRGTRKVDSPQLDAPVLLSATIKKPKEFLYTYPEKKLTPAQIAKFKKFIRRRTKHEPIAYITGKKEFFGFDFLVTPSVLIPRPDTETLISAVLETIGFPEPYSTIGFRESYSHSQTIIDIGTGSGAIAVTLQKLLPQARVFASDASSAALSLARKNAQRLGAKIIFKKGNLLAPFINCHSRRRSDSEGNIRESSNIKKLDSRLPTSLSELRGTGRGNDKIIITANLPYLSRAEWQKTAPEVKKYEPYGALVGGKTGTEIYEKLFREISTLLPSYAPTFLFIEIGHNQKLAITSHAKKILHPQKIEFFKDLAGRWRVAKIIIET